MTTQTSSARQVRVRPLRHSDLGRVLELEDAIFARAAWSPRAYEEELASPARLYLAATIHQPGSGERLVAWAGLSLGEDAEILTIAVDPAHRQTGLARRLLRALTAHASRHRALRVLLEVRASNDAAQTLYASEGFLEIARRRDYYHFPREEAVVMALVLREDPDLPTHQVLVGAPMLAGELDGPQPPLVLDVRWELGRTDGPAQFAAGHIPGAVYADLDTQLAGPPSPAEGRHPLPRPDDLEAAARAWGLTPGRGVVLVDDSAGVAAARGWWILRWAGLEDVRVLDGALRAWREAGLPLEEGPGAPVPSRISLPIARGAAGAMPTATIAEIPGLAARRRVIDVRDTPRYTGEQEPIDPRAGHVPGACNAPFRMLLDEQGRFREAARIRDHFAAAGLTAGSQDEAWTLHCGSGVTAAHSVLAAASVGLTPRLWPGSWSQWSADESREVSTGGAPQAM